MRCGSTPRPAVAGLVLSLLALFAAELAAAGPSPRSAGHAPSAREVLALPAAAGTLERMPLRDVLEVLAGPHQAALFLDRRINPDARLTLTFPEALPLAAAPATTFREVLERVGEEHGFAVAPIESVVYLGPRETASRLRTLDRLRRDDAREMLSREARALLADATLEWADLASPRELVMTVCRQAAVSLSNAEQIPHDLWAAGRLPNLPRITQLSVLLAGFDLTFEFAGSHTIAVRPIRSDEQWRQVYRLPRARARLLPEMEEAFPSAVLKLKRDQLYVSGLVEEHEGIRDWLDHGRRPSVSAPRPASDPVGASADSRYTLRVVRRPLVEVLQEIERSTPYQFSYDRKDLEKAGVSLEELISFDVADADIDVLLQALLQPAELRWRRMGTQIQIFAIGSE